METGQSARNT